MTDFIPTNRDKGYIEGYARALDDILYRMTGASFSGKSYDPATVDDMYIHSYAFDLKDGGRHHPLKDYSSKEEICELMLKEAVSELKLSKS